MIQQNKRKREDDTVCQKEKEKDEVEVFEKKSLFLNRKDDTNIYIDIYRNKKR